MKTTRCQGRYPLPLFGAQPMISRTLQGIMQTSFVQDNPGRNTHTLVSLMVFGCHNIPGYSFGPVRVSHFCLDLFTIRPHLPVILTDNQDFLFLRKGGDPLRRSLILLTLALVLVFAVTQVATAAWGQGFGGRGMGADGWTNLAQELGITKEQSAQIQELQRQHFARVNKIQDQLRSNRQALRIQRWNLDADPEEINAQLEKAAELRDQLRQEAAEFRTQLKGILTEEQQAKLSELRRGGPCLNGPFGKASHSQGRFNGGQ